jgi:hypothetical protein
MKAWFYPMLVLFIFITVSPASLALAVEKMMLSAPVRLCVHWTSRSDHDAGKCHGQFNENRSLVYQLERKDHGREKDKVRALWHL